MTNVLPEINALWVGKALNDIAKCCLFSFIKQGHVVNLYTYDDIDNLPDGIVIKDANVIITEDNIVRHKETGSYALFSDIFRYELLQKTTGIYVDCDVYCIKPLHIPQSGYLFGFEDDNIINGAVLALPSNCALLEDLRNAIKNPFFVPPWYSKSKQKRLKFKKIMGFGRNVADMPWGVIGPDAITYFATKRKVDNLALAIDELYPIHHHRINMLLDNELNLSDITTHRTKAIHLYNEFLRQVDLNSLDKNTILAKLLLNQI